jgi:hypothetical protein
MSLLFQPECPNQLMKNTLFCRNCAVELYRAEALLNNALDFSCEDCFEEWDFEDAFLTDNTFYETYTGMG